MLPPISITFTLNGEECTVEAPPEMCAADVFRELLGLTGTKVDCREGECGSCTVIFNGEPACSCLMTAAQLRGAHVVTVEGIAHAIDHPHEVQEAFVTEGAVQCGHCIPGMIVSAAALLERNPDPSEGEIRHAIAGNICRCTGYAKIVKAIQKASEMRALKR
jgi:aerobic carbon-monoxide dehydrogenase small subunit